MFLLLFFSGFRKKKRKENGLFLDKQVGEVPEGKVGTSCIVAEVSGLGSALNEPDRKTMGRIETASRAPAFSRAAFGDGERKGTTLNAGKQKQISIRSSTRTVFMGSLGVIRPYFRRAAWLANTHTLTHSQDTVRGSDMCIHTSSFASHRAQPYSFYSRISIASSVLKKPISPKNSGGDVSRARLHSARIIHQAPGWSERLGPT